MIDICRPRNASPAKSSMFWLPLAATGLHAPFMFGVPSGLRAGLNVAAFAFAHGQNRREICGQPAIGAARNPAAPPPPPSCPATGADTRNHASAVAMMDATDTRNAWITMGRASSGGPEGPPLRLAFAILGPYRRPVRADLKVGPYDRRGGPSGPPC